MVPSPAPPVSSTGVVFVDLDGTLVATDLLWEALFLAVRHAPLQVLKVPLWVCQGRAVLKSRLAQLAAPDPRILPYRQEVLAFLRQQKEQGRTLVLATATDEKWARSVADELAIFDHVLSSNGRSNLKGQAKLEAIQACCRKHGWANFAYVGDSQADLPIWREATDAYLCCPPARLLDDVVRSGKSVHALGRKPSRLGSVFRAFRPQQWVKNLLLFVPLFVGHAWGEVDKVLAVVVAFLAFSAAASAIYLINDLLDVEADRSHPVKRRRPFASGDLPLAWGPPLAGALLAVAFGMAALALPWQFVAVLAIYVLLTNFYSIWVKRKVILDVLFLAGLYTIRIVAGGTASHIPLSEWLMAFSMFLFASLAFAKRFAELARLARETGLDPEGRGYVLEDLTILESIGPTTGCLAVLVFALYLSSENVRRLYINPTVLWAICPLLLYGITRLWLLARRGKLTEDPVLFACKDRTTILVGLCIALVFCIATFLPPIH